MGDEPAPGEAPVKYDLVVSLLTGRIIGATEAPSAFWRSKNHASTFTLIKDQFVSDEELTAIHGAGADWDPKAGRVVPRKG